jgi:hypothetical protein
MFGSNYYTLVAGLREYALDADTKGFDIAEILAEVEEALSAKDFKSVELLYTYYDCENLVARHNGSAAHSTLGRLSAEQIVSELENPTLLPAALAKVVRAYDDTEGEDAEGVDTSLSFATSLFTAYYELCGHSGSAFLRNWSESDRALRNVISALVARERGVAVDSVTVGGGEVVEQLHRSSAADFGLRGELSYIDALISAMDEQNMVEKERKIDLIRWSVASELSTFDYFSLDAVLAYLVRVNLVARWTVLDVKTGREMFNKLMAELDGEHHIEKAK